MTIDLPDHTTLLSADGAALRVPRALAATWSLPAGSRTRGTVFLPFPALTLAVALALLASPSPRVPLDPKTLRALIALEAYGVPVLHALLDAGTHLPLAVDYTLRAVHDVMRDKSGGRRVARAGTFRGPVPPWCRAVLEERAPHALRGVREST